MAENTVQTAGASLILDLNTAPKEVKVDELRRMLEKGDESAKIAAMRQIVAHVVNGGKLPTLLMPVIRYVLPEKSHALKRLSLLYWEAVEKIDPATGQLRPELILACNSLLQDLKHPSEYVCGATLRLLTRIRTPEIIEPLVAAVRVCLEHRHAYVRRNAVWALDEIYTTCPHLVPDAPDLVLGLLDTESDAATRRNALLMLQRVAPEKAAAYINAVLPEVPNFPENMQLAVIATLYKICRAGCPPAARPGYIHCIAELLSASSPSVRYEAAGTLLALSGAPSSVRSAVLVYVDLLVTESDNNVKFVILSRLDDIARRSAHILQDVVLDLLRGLNCPSLEIRRRILALSLDLLAQKNIAAVIDMLKRELNKASSGTSDDRTGEYRQLLVQTVHQCAVRFPEVAADVAGVLMDHISETANTSKTATGSSAHDVICFIREAVERYPDLRASVLPRLAKALPTVRTSKVFRALLWVMGEYSQTAEEIGLAFAVIKEALSDIPRVIAEKETGQKEEAAAAAPDAKKEEPAEKPAAPKKTNVVVLADGTYATQASLPTETKAAAADPKKNTSNLLANLLAGDHLLMACVAYTLAKLAIKASEVKSVDAAAHNRFNAEVLLILANILRLGLSRAVVRPIDTNNRTRIILCINALTSKDHPARKIFTSDANKKAFVALLDEQAKSLQRAADAISTTSGPTMVDPSKAEKKHSVAQVDDLIVIRQLTAASGNEGLNEDADDGSLVGGDDVDALEALSKSDSEAGDNLDRVVQLTGFSDAIYAEAFVYMRQFDVSLEIVCVNQTNYTLQDVGLELSAVDNLKMLERPQPATIAPGCSARLRTAFKVTSTEAAAIFGNIVYEPAGQSVTSAMADRNCVPLNEIKIDSSDYIRPATCTDIKFRHMWAEFEWENKVPVSTDMPSVQAYLDFVVQNTSMNCLTPQATLAGDCTFLSANLYARSVFNEDALANVSVEYADGKVTGFVRIRSQSQGIALSMGEKLLAKTAAYQAEKAAARAAEAAAAEPEPAEDEE